MILYIQKNMVWIQHRRYKYVYSLHFDEEIENLWMKNEWHRRILVNLSTKLIWRHYSQSHAKFKIQAMYQNNNNFLSKGINGDPFLLLEAFQVAIQTSFLTPQNSQKNEIYRKSNRSKYTIPPTKSINWPSFYFVTSCWNGKCRQRHNVTLHLQIA